MSSELKPSSELGHETEPESESDHLITTSDHDAHTDTDNDEDNNKHKPNKINKDKNNAAEDWHGSIPGATFNMSNMVVASGMLALPFAVTEAGFIPGLCLLLFHGFVLNYSLRLLLRTGVSVGAGDYEELMRHCFGVVGYYILLTLIFILDYFAMLAALIIMSDSVTPFVRAYLIPNVSRLTCLITATLCASTPLAFMRDLDSLSVSSATSVAVTCTMIIIIAVRGIPDREKHVHDYLSPIKSGVFSAFAAMSFAFVVHDTAFQVYGSLSTRRRNLASWNIVSGATASIVVFISVVYCIITYLAFGEHVLANPLDNFELDDDFANSCRVLLGVSMLLTYPVALYMCRHVLGRVIFSQPGKLLSTTWHIVLTASLVTTTLIITSMVQDLGLVQTIAGAISGLTLAFILPASCALRVSYMSNGSDGLYSIQNISPALLLTMGVIAFAGTVPYILNGGGH